MDAFFKRLALCLGNRWCFLCCLNKMAVIWCHGAHVTSFYSLLKQKLRPICWSHCSDVTMTIMASEITGNSTVWSKRLFNTNIIEIRNKSPHCWPFVRKNTNHWLIPLTKDPVVRKAFPWNDVIMFIIFCEPVPGIVHITWLPLLKLTLQWRYNERDGVSNHQPTVYSGAGQRKHQSSASLAFVRGEFTGDRWIPHTKGQ